MCVTVRACVAPQLRVQVLQPDALGPPERPQPVPCQQRQPGPDPPQPGRPRVRLLSHPAQHDRHRHQDGGGRLQDARVWQVGRRHGHHGPHAQGPRVHVLHDLLPPRQRLLVQQCRQVRPLTAAGPAAAARTPQSMLRAGQEFQKRLPREFSRLEGGIDCPRGWVLRVVQRRGGVRGVDVGQVQRSRRQSQLLPAHQRQDSEQRQLHVRVQAPRLPPPHKAVCTCGPVEGRCRHPDWRRGPGPRVQQHVRRPWRAQQQRDAGRPPRHVHARPAAARKLVRRLRGRDL